MRELKEKAAEFEAHFQSQTTKAVTQGISIDSDLLQLNSISTTTFSYCDKCILNTNVAAAHAQGSTLGCGPTWLNKHFKGFKIHKVSLPVKQNIISFLYEATQYVYLKTAPFGGVQDQELLEQVLAVCRHVERNPVLPTQHALSKLLVWGKDKASALLNIYYMGTWHHYVSLVA